MPIIAMGAEPDLSLVTLLHLCDSLFPVGAYGHSDGLEAATAAGRVSTGADLGAWMRASLAETFARTDGPALAAAWRAFGEYRWVVVDAVDAESHALRPSSTARQASRSMGARLVGTWRRLRPDERLTAYDARRVAPGPTLPVAFGLVCASADIALDAALTGYAYSRLAASASAAMRLVAVGQHEAHGLLAETLRLVPAAVTGIVDGAPALSAFAPALDLAAMSQQYVHSRLFRS